MLASRHMCVMWCPNITLPNDLYFSLLERCRIVALLMRTIAVAVVPWRIVNGAIMRMETMQLDAKAMAFKYSWWSCFQFFFSVSVSALFLEVDDIIITGFASREGVRLIGCV
jgi:hypothetical protein